MRQGYVCVRPMCKRERVVRGHLKTKIESLFPGYIFIQMFDDSNWSPLRSTRGVSHVVSFGGRPLAVSEKLVGDLLQRAEIELTPAYKIGDNVRLAAGNYAELDAIFMAMDGEDRVILLIQLLSRRQQVSVPLANIAAR